MPRPNDVGVGIAVCAVHKGKVLMLRRIGAHAANVWAFPGGWVDLDDWSLPAACDRELTEEVGMATLCHGDFQLLDVTTEYHQDLGVRTVTVYMFIHVDDEDIEFVDIMEPEKCSELRWVDLTEQGAVPGPLFPGLRGVLPLILEKVME